MKRASRHPRVARLRLNRSEAFSRRNAGPRGCVRTDPGERARAGRVAELPMLVQASKASLESSGYYVVRWSRRVPDAWPICV